MREIPVLVYHHIGNYPGEMMEDGILPETFETQMKFFKENRYTIVSLKQAIDHMNQAVRLPPKSVALTFDGGYQDVLQNVLPVLEKYHFLATFFIIPETVGGERRIRGGTIKCLSWDEIKQLAAGQMEIGLLAYSGGSIRKENYREDAIIERVTADMEILSREMDCPINYCAFKEGVPKPPLWNFLKQQGFQAVVTQCPTNRRAAVCGIGRIQIDDDDQNIFLTKISKTYLFFKDKRSWKYIRKYKLDKVGHWMSETWDRIRANRGR